MTYVLGALPTHLRRTRRLRPGQAARNIYRQRTAAVNALERTQHSRLYRSPEGPARELHSTAFHVAPGVFERGIALRGFMVPGDSGDYADALGFSLKPPKFVRRIATTVKKAATDTYKEAKHLATIKNLAIVGGATAVAFGAPMLLPLLAKGAASAGRGIVGLFKHGAGLLAPPDFPTAPAGGSSPGTAAAMSLPDLSAAAGAMMPAGSASGGGFSSGGGGGGAPSMAPGGDAGTDAGPPAQAGMGGGLAMLAVGALALYAFSKSNPKRKRGR